MKSIKVLMILESTFPPDIRVEKEAKELLLSGFDLSLVCVDDFQNSNDWYGMKLYKVPLKNNIFFKLRRLISTIHPEFYQYLDYLLKYNKFDILHVHDLRLVPTILKLKKKYDIKVIADLHENYPAGIREWTKAYSGMNRVLNKYFNSYEKWYKIEKEVVEKVDKVIAVVDEMKDRMIDQHKVTKDKVVVVSNLEDKYFVQKATIDNELLQKYKDKFVILYIGGFGVHRGLDTAIKSMKYINENDIVLLLVGKGSKKIESEFKEIIKINNLEDKVELVDWQPFDKVFTYQKLASVCIVPHNSNEHTNNTIPHKLYQYMMVGKPIVVSSCLPLARIVKEANSGFVFESGDSQGFAEKILKIYNNKNFQKEFSENGLKYTFEDKHTWQEESKKLLDMYNNYFCNES